MNMGYRLRRRALQWYRRCRFASNITVESSAHRFMLHLPHLGGFAQYRSGGLTWYNRTRRRGVFCPFLTLLLRSLEPRGPAVSRLSIIASAQ